MFTVSFFGHRYIDNFRRIEERVERQIRQLIVEHEFVEFLVGRDGDFDQIVSSAVIRAKKNIRDDNSALIWVLPYPSSELQNNNEEFHNYYDEIEICEEARYIQNRLFKSETVVWWIVRILCFSAWSTGLEEHIRRYNMRLNAEKNT